MEPILLTFPQYAKANAPSVGVWPADKIRRRAVAVQYKVDLDLYSAGLPSLSLSQSPRYFLNSRLFPIPTWELAARMELERMGAPGHTAALVQDNWTTPLAYAQTYSRNQGPSYLRKVQAHAEKTDPLPAGPYGTRRPEIWAVSFLKIRP